MVASKEVARKRSTTTLALVVVGASFTALAQGGENTPPLRIREGAHLQKAIGHFTETSGRVVFTVEGHDFLVLENLALERITKNSVNSVGKKYWRINALVTEFNKANYLLITRAVLSRKPGKDDNRFFFKSTKAHAH